MEIFLQLKARWKLRPHGRMEDGGQNTTSEFEFRGAFLRSRTNLSKEMMGGQGIECCGVFKMSHI